MSRASFIRSSLTGTALVAISLLTICEVAAIPQRNTDAEVSQPTTTTTEVISTECTTTSTTTNSTTSSTTAAETTTELMMIAEAPTTTVQVNTVQIEPEPTTAWVEPNPLEQTYTELPISDYERILLCNVVAREYGSDWVSVYDKACVVAVVMNRVNSPQFPNTIYEVLTQPYQFSGYLASDSYSYQVTDSVIESVDYYFSHQEEFGNWLYFEGDGTYNYLR